MSTELTAAYAECRAIARREAKNFYFAFLALPAHKSDAMCAVYAFMRRADDISDDESFSMEDRRQQMQTWLNAWRAARDNGATGDPVFLALTDTQKRFNISNELLEQLVRGTSMDLDEVNEGTVQVHLSAGHAETAPRELQVYESFDALYRYCYLVASVVGLVCIHIFGYTDPMAEQFAEHTGIAFQLTNILRDVREDAERGRIYLPLSDLAASHVELEDLVHATEGRPGTKELTHLLQVEIERAREYYRASDRLIPLLDRDSRAAMQVLTGIYRRLLERIAADPSRIFTERASVPTTTKLALLASGMVRSFANRVRA